MTALGESRGIPAPSFSDETVQAMLLTYERYARATGRVGRGDTVSTTKLERFDRVLDELVAHPDRTSEPDKMVGNAWGNAGKVVRDHQRVIVRSYGSFEDDNDEGEIHLAEEIRQAVVGQASSDSLEHLEAELRDLVSTAPFTPRDRLIGELLLDGLEADQIAEALDVTVPVAQVAISRFRNRAQLFWQAA